MGQAQDGEEDSVRSMQVRLREDGIPFKAGLLHFALGETDEAFGAMRLDWPLPWDEAAR